MFADAGRLLRRYDVSRVHLIFRDQKVTWKDAVKRTPRVWIMFFHFGSLATRTWVGGTHGAGSTCAGATRRRLDCHSHSVKRLFFFSLCFFPTSGQQPPQEGGHQARVRRQERVHPPVSQSDPRAPAAFTRPVFGRFAAPCSLLLLLHFPGWFINQAIQELASKTNALSGSVVLAFDTPYCSRVFCCLAPNTRAVLALSP